MEYTIIAGGRSYDLPKKTLDVMENLDTVLKFDSVKGLSVRQKFERMHYFSKNILGEEACKAVFGSSSLDEIDLSDLTITIKKIVDAYDKPVNDYDVEQSRAKINQLPIEKIISIANAAEKMHNKS